MDQPKPTNGEIFMFYTQFEYNFVWGLILGFCSCPAPALLLFSSHSAPARLLPIKYCRGADVGQKKKDPAPAPLLLLLLLTSCSWPALAPALL